LLDESTSALDLETRQVIVRNLLEEFRDRIVLFVTHDVHVTSQVTHVLDMAAINRAERIDAVSSSQLTEEQVN
jgi:ABC-type transport system involved in cytochrome bd biosynthesis fused ATPase/permease subunit